MCSGTPQSRKQAGKLALEMSDSMTRPEKHSLCVLAVYAVRCTVDCVMLYVTTCNFMSCFSPLISISSSPTDIFPICKGTLLASRYKVQAFLGEGSFGKVAKCVDIVNDTKMAVKIIKDKPYFTQRALEEVEHKQN